MNLKAEMMVRKLLKSTTVQAAIRFRSYVCMHMKLVRRCISGKAFLDSTVTVTVFLC